MFLQSDASSDDSLDFHKSSRTTKSSSAAWNKPQPRRTKQQKVKRAFTHKVRGVTRLFVRWRSCAEQRALELRCGHCCAPSYLCMHVSVHVCIAAKPHQGRTSEPEQHV